jgi:hypothetical protein
MSTEKESRKRRKSSKRSSWWSYFEETIKDVEAICTIEKCPNPKVEARNTTTPLIRHMEKYHQEIVDKKNLKSIDRTFSNMEKKEISKYTVLMMIMENRPFNMVQGEYYKIMMSKIQQNWIPTRHLIYILTKFMKKFSQMSKMS